MAGVTPASGVTPVTVLPERPLWRRVAGALLVAYGVAGLLLVVGGAILVASSVARLDGLAATLETQRQVLVRSLDATGTFLRDARTGTGNVQSSLLATMDSARQTATLSRGLATAMDELAAASTISILGSQPFAGLGDTFSGVARQASAMGISLEAAAAALALNSSDLQQVRDDLGAIQTEIDALRRQISGAALDNGDLHAVSRALAGRLAAGSHPARSRAARRRAARGRRGGRPPACVLRAPEDVPPD